MSDRVGLAVSAPSEKPENRMTQVLEPPARIDEDLVALNRPGFRSYRFPCPVVAGWADSWLV